MRIAAAFVLFAGIAVAAQPDPVMDAMQAELQRSMTLSLQKLETPYFVSYSIDDIESWSGSATLGGLLSSNHNHYRQPQVRMRVGDYKFDNSNFSGGVGAGAHYSLSGFPLDDDPLAIRQYLWLTTDSAYKRALQSTARKRAALRSITVADQLPDFSPVPPYSLAGDYNPIHFDQNAWNDRLRKISGLFAAYPALRTSQVDFTAIDGVHRFVTTEGTKIREQQAMASVTLRASAQASDGMIVRDMQTFYSQDPAKMFPETELVRSAKQLGEQVINITKAPLGENYSGPILFEGTSSPQLLAELLGRNLHITRKPVGTNQVAATELEGRRGVRIMPEFFDVTDDPTLNLFGKETVDDEGVPEKPISVVEKGVLKEFFRTRLPVRGYSESNGRARMGTSPAPTNLIIKARETASLAELRKKMMDLCEQRGLAYGIVIRKLDFPSSAPLEEARKMIAAASSSGAARPVALPLYVYKVFADGHEEMIRGVRLRGLNARSLKDILAAGNDEITFNYLENGAPFALLGLGGSMAEVSIVAPSVLIDDLELVKTDDEMPKLPIATPPSITQAAAK